MSGSATKGCLIAWLALPFDPGVNECFAAFLFERLTSDQIKAMTATDMTAQEAFVADALEAHEAKALTDALLQCVPLGPPLPPADCSGLWQDRITEFCWSGSGGSEQTHPLYGPCGESTDDSATRECLATWLGLGLPGTLEAGVSECMSAVVVERLTPDQLKAMTATEMNMTWALEAHEAGTVATAVIHCMDAPRLLVITSGRDWSQDCLRSQVAIWAEDPSQDDMDPQPKRAKAAWPDILEALFSAAPDPTAIRNALDLFDACSAGRGGWVSPNADKIGWRVKAAACVSQKGLNAALQCIAGLPCVLPQLTLNGSRYGPGVERSPQEVWVEAMIACADFYTLIAEKAVALVAPEPSVDEIRACLLRSYSETDIKDAIFKDAPTPSVLNSVDPSGFLTQFHYCYLPTPRGGA